MSRSLAVELLHTTGTPGWQYVLQIAQQIVQEITDDALDGKAEMGDARGARDFFRTFQARIDSASHEVPSGTVSTVSM